MTDYNIEYRCQSDDAWYTCAVILDHTNHHLRVKFSGFVQSFFDEVFSVNNFSSNSEIEEFINRFRPLSTPVDDNECSKLVQGVTVCAMYRNKDGDRYFDAVVDAVCSKEHTPEECLCSYLLCWQHGPGKGNVTKTTIEDICLITNGDGDIHPKVAEFTNLAKQLKGASVEPQVFGSLGDSCRVGSSAGKERFHVELSDHDVDMGGVKRTDRHHYILLENIDKDLCPLSMMDFIREHTSITAQTYVFPCLLAETYARGAVMVDSSTKLKRIYEFLNNPNHFITSFSGRPWVMAEDDLRSGTFNTNLQPKYENYSTKNELKVVRLGTEEYRKSKQLKDLYVEFRDHLNRLVRRLDMEEEKTKRDPFSFCKL